MTRFVFKAYGKTRKIEAEKATDAYSTANKKLLWTTPNFKQGVWRENGDLNTFVWTEGNFFD